MAAAYSLSRDEARRLAVSSQLLAGERPAGVQAVVEHIGYLQLDPTNAVARSHLLVLWSRLGGYDVGELERLLWEERALFQWRAFVIPTREWPLYAAIMRRFPYGDGARPRLVRAWLAENASFRDSVLAELAERGPLAQREFEDRSVSPWRSSGWTANRNVSQMLEFLWAGGHVLVAGRRGQERVWDLAERCLPPGTLDQPALAPEEAAAISARRGLRALGVATATGLGQRLALHSLPVADAVDELRASGEFVDVTIEGARGRWLALAERLEAPVEPARTTLLSPFDSLISDRGRTKRLFDFDYSLEIYVPKAKRRYGYFVLPVLHGDRLVGRADPQVDRQRRRLVVNAVHREPGVRWPERAVAGALEDLARFAGADGVDYA